MASPTKIAIVTTHPVHYFQSMYREINSHPDLDVTALFLSNFGMEKHYDPEFDAEVEWESSQFSGYSWKVLSTQNCDPRLDGFFSVTCPKVWREIIRSNYDVIWLHGYNYFGLVLAFLAAKVANKRILYRSETHLNLSRSPLKRIIRDTALRIYFKMMDGFLAIGTLNHRYYEALGVPAHKITLVPYTVDNKKFYPVSGGRAAPRAEKLIAYGLDANLPTIIYCSKFSARKNPELVLRAFHKFCDGDQRANLLMVGSGPLFDSVKETAETLGCSNIYFTGFVSQNELPGLLQCGDLFVLASENEPWGLVVNEAMASGMPVLSTSSIGSAYDLIEDGVNGIHLPELSIECIARHFAQLTRDSEVLRGMGLKSLEKMQGWDYRACLDGVVKNLQALGFDVRHPLSDATPDDM